MKVSFIVPCRNKAQFVGRTVQTVLSQTYSPMEIVLSDQGSTDGTYEIIKELAEKYTGPNTVRVLQCPLTEYSGMAGLNQHLNWLNDQIEGDIVIMCSADDLNHPDRVKFTVEAFEKHNPSYVGTAVKYLDADYADRGEVTGYGFINGEMVREDGFVDPVQNINELIGSSASSAWARDLFNKYGPLENVESQDITLPFLATVERGLFYVNRPLHAYVRHANPDNTGMEGVVRDANKQVAELAERILALPQGLERDKLEKDWARAKGFEHATIETNNYHFTSIFFALIRRVQQRSIHLTQELDEALLRKAFEGAGVWVNARDNITMMRVEPKAMRV